MSRNILNEKDDHSKAFRRGNPHFRHLQPLLDLLADISFCSIGKVLVEKLL